MDLPYAEEVNYWKSGKSSPEVWIAKTGVELAKAGGRVLGEAFGSEPTLGRSAYMLAFELDGQHFKVIWPVLPSKGGDDRAARIQAATMLYHDVKARCVSARVLGARTAFFSYLLLPNGRTAAELSAPELMDQIPGFFGGSQRKLLPE